MKYLFGAFIALWVGFLATTVSFTAHASNCALEPCTHVRTVYQPLDVVGALGSGGLSEVTGLHKSFFVKVICDKAHGEVNGDSEEACGRAQDVTNTEYLCDKTDCWVEVR